jgi:hypothetical protein
MPLELTHMAAHVAPALDLPCIILVTTAHEIAAIPLKPATRVVGMNPAFLPPVGQRLGGIDTEEIEIGVAAFCIELGFLEPVGRKLTAAIGEVLAAENTHRQQLLRRQFRSEPLTEIPTDRRTELVAVALLHSVVDRHTLD